MPDWNYRPIFKPFLNLLPPTRAQRWVLRGVQALGSNPIGRKSIDLMGHMQPPDELAFYIGDTRFLSRVFLGLEIDPEGLGQKAFAKFGFGALEMDFAVACKSIAKNDLLIPIIPILETSDLDTPEFLKMVIQTKCFRLADSVTQHLLALAHDERIQFFLKLQKWTLTHRLEFIFTVPGAESKDHAIQLLPLLKKYNFHWIQVLAPNSQEATIDLIKDFNELNFFALKMKS